MGFVQRSLPSEPVIFQRVEN